VTFPDERINIKEIGSELQRSDLKFRKREKK
jgi:hypothetical protein